MRFIHHAEIDSTNAEAKRLVEAGDTGPCWIRADSQNSGRGRREREWVSKPGNLYCTGLYPHFGDARQAANLSFVAAIALAQTLEHYIDPEKIGLKWPNDVLITGQKTAGILLEGGGDWIAIGIGVNLLHHPEGLEFPATHVMAHIDPERLAGPEPVMSGPEPFLAILAERVDHWRHILMTDGFEAIRSIWTEKAYKLPGEVTVRLANERFSGFATGLGENGELRLRLENGTVRDIHAGDVFFGSRN